MSTLLKRYELVMAMNGDRRLSPLDVRVALQILRCFNTKDGYARIGVGKLADLVGKSDRAVQLSIATLRATGWLIVEVSRGRSMTNRFTFRFDNLPTENTNAASPFDAENPNCASPFDDENPNHASPIEPEKVKSDAQKGEISADKTRSTVHPLSVIELGNGTQREASLWCERRDSFSLPHDAHLPLPLEDEAAAQGLEDPARSWGVFLDYFCEGRGKREKRTGRGWVKRNATPARKMLMSSAWRKASQGFLAKHPHCAPCARKGITRAATCTDHIIAHKGDPRLFWNRGNWQPACAACNSAKAAREEGGFGNPVR